MTVAAHPSHGPRGFGWPPEPVVRLSVAQYHAIIEAGALGDGDPVELVEGWLVPKMTKRPPRALATKLVEQAIGPHLPADSHVRLQEPVTLEDSEPEPDVAVIRGTPRAYAARHPGPREVLLLVEVADHSLERDRGAKKRAYARAGIASYWIVNLAERCLEIYADPSAEGGEPDYRTCTRHGELDAFQVVVADLGSWAVRVAELLP